MELEANNPNLKSFIEVNEHSDFPIQNLPFGIFKLKSDGTIRTGVAIGDYILDLTEIDKVGLFTNMYVNNKNIFNQITLNKFMSLGKDVWTETRNTISKLLRHDEATLRDNQQLRDKALHHKDQVIMQLPIAINGYTDFYSSKEHATNLGILFRGKENPLTPNWLHIPIGYDGRASSIVVSGTNFHRPCGQIRPGNDGEPTYSESKALDTEIEVAFIVGTPNEFGTQITTKDAPKHIFGMVLLSDWSARDIQRWEYVPLGPFLGKNFCTSISPWIVTMDALEPFRCSSCKQDPQPLEYLQSNRDYSYNINLTLELQTKNMSTPQCISKTNYKDVYWDFCQQLAHHTVNGCPMQTGDIFASGTISSKEPASYGSMVELTWGGQNPISLVNGEQRKFIEDGDTVSIKGWCQANGYRVGFGDVFATILPAK